MEEQLLCKGYVMVSRALLMEICEKRGAAKTDDEAFLRVLIHVNYKENIAWYNGIPLKCARGESVISFVGWADILGWKRGHVRSFIKRCITKGVIEMVADECPSHIRVPHYDAWTGKAAGQGLVKKPVPKPSTNPFEDSLQQFIDRYSQVTHLPAESKGRLRSLWKHLSTAERQHALDGIEDYYYGLSNVNFCFQSAKYLEYRTFENDVPN